MGLLASLKQSEWGQVVCQMKELRKDRAIRRLGLRMRDKSPGINVDLRHRDIDIGLSSRCLSAVFLVLLRFSPYFVSFSLVVVLCLMPGTTSVSFREIPLTLPRKIWKNY